MIRVPQHLAVKSILWTAMHSVYAAQKKKKKKKKEVLFDHICKTLLSLVRLSQFGRHHASDLFLMLSDDCTSMPLGW